MLFAGREVRIGKNCARGLENGPRLQDLNNNNNNTRIYIAPFP